MYYLIPLIIGLVALIVFLYFRAKEKRVIAVFIKGFVSLMFIATALVAWLTSKNSQNNFGVFVFIGLVFGLAGDVLLDIKFIDLKREMLYTKLGFLAFLFGHVFYVTGLFINFYDFNTNILYLIIPAIISLALMVVTLLMEKFTKVRYEKMKLFVIVYSFVLFFTVSIYMSAAIQGGFQKTTNVIMAFALISFALSDLILNNTYFAPGFNTPLFVITNHLFYYIAQFAIALSLFYLL